MSKMAIITTDQCDVAVGRPTDAGIADGDLCVHIGQTSLDDRIFLYSEGGSGKIWHVALGYQSPDEAVPCDEMLAYAHMPKLLDAWVSECKSGDDGHVRDLARALAYAYLLGVCIHDNIPDL